MLKFLWATKVRLLVVLLVLIGTITLMIMAQSGILGFTTSLWQKPKEKVDISYTVRKTLPVSEINGLAVSTDKVIDSEQKGWPLIRGKKMLVLVRWNVRLGINAKNIKLSVDETNRIIHAELPKVKVISMEQTGAPHIYDQAGSLLDNYSSQDVLNAVDAKSDALRSEILRDETYQSQTIESLEKTLSYIINSAPGVKDNYTIEYTVEK